jgi:S1-C subfamily serine protease
VVDGYRSPDGRGSLGIKQFLEILADSNINGEAAIGVAFPSMEDKTLGMMKVTIAASTQVFAADIVGTDPSHDLAIVRPKGNPFKQMPALFAGAITGPAPRIDVRAVAFSQTRPRDVEAIFACGYPFGEPGLVTTAGTVASAWNTRVLLRPQVAGFNDPVEVYNADLRINQVIAGDLSLDSLIKP